MNAARSLLRFVGVPVTKHSWAKEDHWERLLTIHQFPSG